MQHPALRHSMPGQYNQIRTSRRNSPAMNSRLWLSEAKPNNLNNPTNPTNPTNPITIVTTTISRPVVHKPVFLCALCGLRGKSHQPSANSRQLKRRINRQPSPNTIIFYTHQLHLGWIIEVPPIKDDRSFQH